MDKLSQKELLDESFLSKLRTVTKPLTKLAAGVGGAVNAISNAGTSAGIGDVVSGAKSGLEKEKQFFKSKDSELDKAIEELGYYKIGNVRGRGDNVVIDVAELDYDNLGEPQQGDEYNKPLILKWDKETKSFSVIKSPKGVGEDKPNSQPDAQSETQPDAQSQTQLAPKPEDKPQAKPAAKKVPPPSPSALKTQPTQPKLSPVFNQPKAKPAAKPVAKPKPKKPTSNKTSNQMAGEEQMKKNKAAAEKEAKSTKSKPKRSTVIAALDDIKKPGFQQDKVAKNEIKDYLKTTGMADKIKSNPKYRPSIAGRRLTPLQAKKILEKKKRSQKNLIRQLTLLFK